MSLTSINQQTQSLAERLARLQPAMDDTLARLSSGSRLVRPSSDPVGIGLAARYEGRQKRLEAAAVNLQNGASRLQMTDSFLKKLGEAAERMGELATLAQNPSLNVEDRSVYEIEFKGLQEQFRALIGGTTAEIGGTADIDDPQGKFQDRPLFGAAPVGGENLVAGAESDVVIRLPETNLRQGAIVHIFRQDPAGEFAFTISDSDAVDRIKAAVDQIAAGRASVGGAQNRIELAGSALTTAQTNAEAALSRIRDADIATETTSLARRQMLEEATTAMLAQARDVPRQLLPLLSAR